MMGSGRQDGDAAASAFQVTSAAEADLLRRLQNQFGDLDLSELAGGAAESSGTTEGGAVSDVARSTVEMPGAAAASDDEQKPEKGEANGRKDGPGDRGKVKGEDSGSVDSESTPEDPSQEELRAWQEAQYRLAAWAREGKEERDAGPSDALRRRRTHGTEGGVGDDDDKEGKDEGWEELHRPPDLDGQRSEFFPSPPPSEDGELVEKPPPSAGAVEATGGGRINPLLAKLATAEPEILGEKWRRLYSSSVDGLSFRHLLLALRGYDGPTVMIVGTAPSPAHSRYLRALRDRGAAEDPNFGHGALGFFTASPWREGPDFYGTEDCFLFRFDGEGVGKGEGEVPVLRPVSASSSDEKEWGRLEAAVTTKKKGGNYMYLHPTPPSSHASPNVATAYGLGVGGTRSMPRLHITESLEGCRALPWDSSGTFAAGRLLPSSTVDGATEELDVMDHDSLYYFDVRSLEVWGVGGKSWIEKALSSRAKERERSNALARRVRTVDKAQFLDDFRTGFLSADVDGTGELWGHTQHVGGRLDLDLDIDVGCHDVKGS